MSFRTWPTQQLDGFHNAAQSLKLYRRAELKDENGGSPLIEELYVDPLPNNHVLQTVLKPNTTFLIGRKGSGKSTVFQRSQFELRKMPQCASAYIDIKTLYESSQVDPALLSRLSANHTAMDKSSLERLLLHQAFLTTVIGEIRTELHDRIKVSLWEKAKRSISGSIEELFEGFDSILEDAASIQFLDVTAIRSDTVQGRVASSTNTDTGASLGVTIGPTPSINASLQSSDSSARERSEDRVHAETLMRVFNIKEFILRLKVLLEKISVTRLYIFIDDFSELPEPAMRIVVDALLSPLNNWSEELVKFKVAAYPGRIYYGDIDITKIDEVNLDIFKLYGALDVSDMEEKAIDFTRHLIVHRLAYFCKSDPETFITDSTNDEVWRTFFYATMANPRILGYLLFYLHESHILYGRPIGIGAIQDAARKYFSDKLEPYFRTSKFLHESFSERSSVYSLKELLESIVNRSRELRSNRTSTMMQSISGRPPTSHFHIVSNLEGLLATLELNFFVTKYYEQSDRDRRKVAVFALNYGLCQQYTIAFGRPIGDRIYRTYFIERIFDYTPLFEHYMVTHQEIACDSCGEKFGVDALEALRLYGMGCPKCKTGMCHVTNVSRKYEPILRLVDAELLLPVTELGMLQALNETDKPMFARDIAGELDCSYQLIGRRGRFLADRGLVERNENDQGRRIFEITDLAEETYFQDHDYELDVEGASDIEEAPANQDPR